MLKMSLKAHYSDTSVRIRQGIGCDGGDELSCMHSCISDVTDQSNATQYMVQ